MFTTEAINETSAHLFYDGQLIGTIEVKRLRPNYPAFRVSPMEIVNADGDTAFQSEISSAGSGRMTWSAADAREIEHSNNNR